MADHVAVWSGNARAVTPNAYINRTDTGGDWRTLVQATLAADLSSEDATARPGIGTSDGRQFVSVTLDFAADVLGPKSDSTAARRNRAHRAETRQ